MAVIQQSWAQTLLSLGGSQEVGAVQPRCILRCDPLSNIRVRLEAEANDRENPLAEHSEDTRRGKRPEGRFLKQSNPDEVFCECQERCWWAGSGGWQGESWETPLKLNVCFVFPEWIPDGSVLKLLEGSDTSRLTIFSRQRFYNFTVGIVCF